MQIGFIGFGKMGSGMVTKLLADGHEVVIWNRTASIVEEFKAHNPSENLKPEKSIEDLVKSLSTPRVIWLMLPAGNPTEEALNELAKFVEPNDIIVDGGNAYYKDTQRRFETFQMNNISYLGVGVSGGVKARESGYPLMVGGTMSAFEHLKTVFSSLAQPHGAYDYFGEGGAGHFVKMVHNGIEYGMMQAIGEGFGVLDKGGYDLDLKKVAALWQKGTIVSGFLMDRTRDALEKNPELEGFSGPIGFSGEGEWTVEAAKEEDVPVVVIEDSLNFRKLTHTEKEIGETFAAKTVSALRHEFGGHVIKKN